MSGRIEFTELTYEASGEDDFEAATTYKPSTEAARRLRTLMGMPEGARTRLTIKRHETSQGDGWATDAQSDELIIGAKGYPDYELSSDDTLSRLRRRLEHFEQDPAVAARALLGRPDHERCVMAIMDDDSNSLVRVDDVTPSGDILIAKGMTIIGPVLNTAGPGVIVVALDRAEAIEKHPNLGFAYRNFAQRFDTQLREINHRAWLDRQDCPVEGNIFFAEDDEHGVMTAGFRPVDATTVPANQIQHVNEYTDVATSVVLRWCSRRTQPLNLSDPVVLDTAVDDILHDIHRSLDDTRRYNEYTGRPGNHAPGFEPVTDPDTVRTMLRLVFASFNPQPKENHV